MKWLWTCEVCARVFLRVCDLPHVVVWPLGCQNWGFSYTTGCNLCANTPALIFPLGNLCFWSIYLQEQSCTMIPCVFLLCAQVPVFWLCVLPSAFFFSSYPQIISANTHALVGLCPSVSTYQPASQCFSPPLTCTCVRWRAWVTATVSSVARGACACGGRLVCLPLLLKQWLPMGRLSA